MAFNNSLPSSSSSPPAVTGSQELSLNSDPGGVNLTSTNNPQSYPPPAISGPSNWDPSSPVPFGIPHSVLTDLLNSNKSPQFAQLNNNQRQALKAYLLSKNTVFLEYVGVDLEIKFTEDKTCNMIWEGYSKKLVDVFKQKQEELLHEHQRWSMLQQHVSNTNTEMDIMQNTAVEREAMAAEFSQKLQRFQEDRVMMGNLISGEGSTRMVESMCQICNLNPARVVIVPCMHLSCCRTCQVNAIRCPTCRVAKLNTIEISMSET